MESPDSPSSPFDNAKADIILRSYDAVDFHVHSAILQEASPTFMQMFDLSRRLRPKEFQNDDHEYIDGRPVVVLMEDSRTLESLLRLLYPIADPMLDSFECVRAILEAAKKYDTKEAVALVLCAFHTFASTDSLRAWAAAYRLGLEEEARCAAKFALRLPILDTFPPDLYDLPAGVYYKLLDFHRKQGAVSDDFTFCESHRCTRRLDSTENTAATTAPGLDAASSATEILSLTSPTTPFFVESPTHDPTENTTATVVSEHPPAILDTETMPSTPPTAPSPFNNTSGDIILQSIDLVDFRVHGVILSEASPFFKDLFSLRQPPTNGEDTSGGQEYRDGCPVIVLTEYSHTLDSLLRLCYPIPDPVLVDLMDVRDVYEAAVKYQMEEATVLMTKSLRTFASKEPIRLWAVACQLQLEPEARYAAESTLELSQLVEFPQEMSEVTAGAYFRLREFHRLRGKVEASFTFCRPIPLPSNPVDTAIATESESYIIPDFFSHPFVDVKCRSQDGVSFRVHRIVLFTASPVLGRLAVDITSQETAVGDLPTIDLAVHSHVLALLLQLCYPDQEGAVVIEDVLTIHALLQTAISYQMDRVVSALQALWTRIVNLAPVRAYFLAVALNWDECARASAKATLDRTIDDVYDAEMEGTSATTYHHLLTYRRACLEAMTRLTTDFQANLPALPATETTLTSTSRKHVSTHHYSTTWYCADPLGLKTHIATQSGCSEARPIGRIATLESILAGSREPTCCSMCRGIAKRLIRYMEFQGQVDNAICKIVLQSKS